MSAPPYPKIETRFVRKEDHTLDLEKLRRPEFGLVEHWLATEKIDGTNIRVSLEPVTATMLVGGVDKDVIRDWQVKFYGRTDKAQMPDFIQEYLEVTFKLENMQNLWLGRRNCEKCGGTGQYDSGEPKPLTRSYPGHRAYQCDCVEPYPITLYGEAYGARIQKGGGDYRRDGDISFRLFDVLVGERSWLDWGNVRAVTDMLNIKTVPVVSTLGLSYSNVTLRTNDIVTIVRSGYKSIVAEEEGIPRLAEGIVARTDPYLFDGQGRRLVWKLKTKDF